MRIIPKKESRSATALRARGLRLTAPRRLILEVVRGTDTHPTAAFVYARVRRRLPRVSLATVYRNLRRLAAEGFLLERADEGGIRFDANLTRHDHFTCLSCRRIFDVPAATRRPQARAVPGAGFEILDQRTEYYGRCAACRRRSGVITGGRVTLTGGHPTLTGRATRAGGTVILRGDTVTPTGDTVSTPVARATAQRRTLNGGT